MSLIVGLIAFALKILMGAIGVGIVFGVVYVFYKLISLIPDSRVTTPIKTYSVIGFAGCVVMFIIFFPVFDPGAYVLLQDINSHIPPWLQFWHQATG